MQRILKRAFENGELQPQSKLFEIKHIGDYLYTRLLRSFAPNRQSISIRKFAKSIERLTIERLKEKLQTALQNKRNNQCIQSPGLLKYHVQDFNQKGYEVMINLIKIMARNDDGYNLGRNFRFDASRLRMPARRSDSAKTLPCMSRRQCMRNGGNFHNSTCLPQNNARGFAGVYPYSGQKRNPINRNQQLGGVNNSFRRGRYTKSPTSNVSWRKPGRMRKL
tara:strand:- start:660 stop:1322 length:663 start_codon:yes stop_codon:yes gene_type:complete